jgi:Uma2 family endonuclease
MGLPAEKLRPATYDDLLRVPSHLVAEIIGGDLRTLPRPAPRHARVSSDLGGELYAPFRRGVGGPGGWQILDEPELHFGAPGLVDVLVPDLAGWRVERLPELPDTAFISVTPDWVCEVLSPSTAAQDRADKMPIYAREGVRHVWLLDPIAKTLEVFALGAENRWVLVLVEKASARVRAEPFEAIELDLAALWP